MQSRDTRPTYFKTNKYLDAFQGITDSYGVARYQEINPSMLSPSSLSLSLALFSLSLALSLTLSCPLIYHQYESSTDSLSLSLARSLSLMSIDLPSIRIID
jgi:hypothetical protein